MSDLSTQALTIYAVAVIVLATAFLVVSDRVQTATNRRRRQRVATRTVRSGPQEVVIDQRARPLTRPGPPWWKRIRSILGLGVLGVLLGTLAAIAFGLFVAVAYFFVEQVAG